MKRIALATLVATLMTGGAVTLGAAPKQQYTRRCVADSSHLNWWVFTNVSSMTPGAAVSLQGIYFTNARRPAPFYGSAMMAADGSVRIGIFVHSATGGTNDFTMSGVTDANFVGPVSFDSDGDPTCVALVTPRLRAAYCSGSRSGWCPASHGLRSGFWPGCATLRSTAGCRGSGDWGCGASGLLLVSWTWQTDHRERRSGP
jgi:hypothetical protein